MPANSRWDLIQCLKGYQKVAISKLLRSEYYLKTVNLVSAIRPCYTHTHNKTGNGGTVQRNTKAPSNLWSWTLLRWSHHSIHCGHTF